MTERNWSCLPVGCMRIFVQILLRTTACLINYSHQGLNNHKVWKKYFCTSLRFFGHQRCVTFVLQQINRG